MSDVDSPVVEQEESDMAVMNMTIEFAKSRDACMSMENKENQVEQDPGYFVPSGNDSGLMVSKPVPSLVSLDVLMPLPSWSRPSHPTKKIKILINIVNVWTIGMNVNI